MSRNPSTGVYSPPPNTTAIPATIISSALFNAFKDDVSSTFNAPWPVSLGGTGTTSLAGFLSTLGGLPIAGGTMTGALTLSGNATGALHAVTKQQLDFEIATRAPLAHTQLAATISDFAAAVGSSLGTQSINALSDVTITNPVEGQTLKRVAGVWVNVNSGVTEYNLGALSALGLGAGKITQPHGLSALPRLVSLMFRCRVASNGFSVGQEGVLNNVFTNGSSFGAHYYCDSTNIYISGYGNYYVISPLGNNVPLTDANFDLIIRVFA